MRHGVLDNDRLHALGMGNRQAHADRTAIIIVVQHIAVQSELLGEIIDDLGQMIEGVMKPGCGRRIAFAEAWIIRRNEMIAVGQQRDQRREHPRGGITVQQQDGRRVFRPGLPIEDLQAVDLHRVVGRGRRDRRNWLGLCAGRGNR